MIDGTEAGKADEEAACPYRGLVPFEEKDWAFFFGREKDTRTIVANLSSTQLT